jgi:hypothetical protein
MQSNISKLPKQALSEIRDNLGFSHRNKMLQLSKSFSAAVNYHDSNTVPLTIGTEKLCIPAVPATHGDICEEVEGLSLWLKKHCILLQKEIDLTVLAGGIYKDDVYVTQRTVVNSAISLGDLPCREMMARVARLERICRFLNRIAHHLEKTPHSLKITSLTFSGVDRNEDRDFARSVDENAQSDEEDETRSRSLFPTREERKSPYGFPLFVVPLQRILRACASSITRIVLVTVLDYAPATCATPDEPFNPLPNLPALRHLELIGRCDEEWTGHCRDIFEKGTGLKTLTLSGDTPRAWSKITREDTSRPGVRLHVCADFRSEHDRIADWIFDCFGETTLEQNKEWNEHDNMHKFVHEIVRRMANTAKRPLLKSITLRLPRTQTSPCLLQQMEEINHYVTPQERTHVYVETIAPIRKHVSPPSYYCDILVRP